VQATNDMQSAIRRILVVEDDAENALMVSAILESAGYDVITVTSGAEALAFLSRLPGRCLILLDLRMSDMNGWEVLSELRAAGRHEHRVVIMSGVAATSIPRGTAALRKPFTSTQLLSTVREHAA
jgi:CheY-like chemotaxis protein